MTEPGTSSLGKTTRSPLPFLTSGLMSSAGMKSCTGRHWDTLPGGTQPSLSAHWAACSRSYEVQLESKVRRKGLGKFLLQILQLLANR